MDDRRLEGVIVQDLITGERMLRHRRCVREHEVIKGDIPELLSVSRVQLKDRVCTACGIQLRLLGVWEL